MLLAHLRLSVRDPPTTASLPHPVTMSLANPQGGSSVLGRHTGRTVDGYVLAVNGVFNYGVKYVFESGGLLYVRWCQVTVSQFRLKSKLALKL